MIDAERAGGTPELARKSEAISRGLEHLVEKLESGDDSADGHSCHFDLIVVGSGYGAAIAVDAFSKKRVGASKRMPRICVLERGNEYLPGSFPTQMSDLAGHIRFATGSATARGKTDGLFDIRVGNDVSAVVANGVGGGSLINAGVMAEPCSEVFSDARWPKAIRDDKTRDDYYTKARELLEAEFSNGVESAPWDKTRALERLGGGTEEPTSFKPVWITVALPGRAQDSASPFKSCIGCGDCATGCNFSAKKSVDATLLAKARARKVEIYSGATVRQLTRDGDGWRVVVLYTDELLRARRGKALEVTAKHVILAAGTLGSTEILMRSRSLPKGPKVSGRIGEAFSANGDMLAAAYGLEEKVNAIATPTEAFAQRRVGPTITGMIDKRTGDPESDVVIQDLSVPGALRKAFEECFALVRTLDELPRMQLATLGPKSKDPCAIDREAFRKTLPVALIGHDAATGRLRMPVAEHGSDLGEGILTVDWPRVASDPRRDASQEVFEGIVAAARKGGSAYANPLWRPLPAGLGALFGQPRGPLLTVHPLGGCVMGDDVTSGVVNHLGQVFDPDDSPPRNGGLHRGLVVLDGSIIPMSLGINPALTIAAVTLRAVDRLVTLWGFQPGPTSVDDPAPPGPRAVFRDVPDPPEKPIETQVELLERVRGPIVLRDRNHKDCTLELTLCFQPASIAKLGVDDGTASVAPPPFVLDSSRSWMRIRKPTADGEVTLVEGKLSGTLDVLKTERSLGIARVFRGLVSWVIRRAVRDGLQNARGRRAGLDLPPSDFVKNRCAMLAVCGHAGETRRLNYRMKIVKGTVECADGLEKSSFEGKPIRTQKRLTYGAGLLLGLLPTWKQSACNPWLQLSRMKVTGCPGQPVFAKRPQLELYLPFLVERRSPLLRITQQQDHPAALGDLLSFVLYVVRILIREHALSFRKPDEPPPAALSRLPGDVPGLPPPATVELQSGVIPESIAGFRKGDPVMIRLTRYRPLGGAKRAPILLIHGYSASGTTFAHESLPCSLARHFVDESRDVWILDLRSSTGMPTARYPWSFEAIGFGDIPLAVDYVCRATNTDQIDVFAHCMGAAMLSMALLGDYDVPPLSHDTQPALRRRLPGRIARLVLSQIGPAMLLSPANLYRAYLLSYVKQFLPVADYRFRAAPNADYSKVDGLLDRLLTTLPYTDKEFRRENPLWPLGKYVRWASIRHRMDILYGRVFELANMADATLNSLDAFFGPLNFDTVAQVIHFAGPGCITDQTGINCYVTPDRMLDRFTFPVQSIHGEKNGLADVKTLERMKALFKSFNGAFESEPIKDFGHQDCLIGVGAREHVFGRVSEFLDRTTPAAAKAVPPVLVKVVWPSRGARVIRAKRAGSSTPATARRIVVDDAGGSGKPVSLILAPVTKSGSDSYELQAGAGFCNLKISNRQRIAPYVIKVPPSFAPLGGLLAVALVYRQVPCIGPDTSHTACLNKSGTESKDPLKDELVALLGRGGSNGPLPCLLELEAGPAGPRSAPPIPQGPVTFAFASCQYPEDLLDGSPPLNATLPGPADAAMLRLAKQLDAAERRPQFLVLTGDQVYVDATAGLFDPRADSDRFRIPYENWLSSLGMRSVLGRLPVYMMLDDHEIGNNWEPEARHSSHGAITGLLHKGRKAYWRRQRAGGPAPLHGSHDYLWAPVVSAGVDLFLADTRTRRMFREPGDTLENSFILGDSGLPGPDQAAELEEWLTDRKYSGRPSFVCSPALLLPRHLSLRDPARHSPSALRSDAWDGYPASLYRMLGFLCANEIGNAFFLSGDEHLGIWAEAVVEALDGKKNSVHVRSIHSSGLYSPYPFANAKPEDFAMRDKFTFDYRCGRYRCHLLLCDSAPIGDGVTYITIDDQGSTVTARFDRADHIKSCEIEFKL